MSNIRLFFKESLSLNLVSKLDKSQSHYISKVMRIKENEIFSLFNSSGEWEAKILNITKSIVEFEITNQIRQKENQKELWLAFSPIKSNYFNFMIQKATELGITKFVPIIFERTVVRKLNNLIKAGWMNYNEKKLISLNISRETSVQGIKEQNKTLDMLSELILRVLNQIKVN